MKRRIILSIIALLLIAPVFIRAQGGSATIPPPTITNKPKVQPKPPSVSTKPKTTSAKPATSGTKPKTTATSGKKTTAKKSSSSTRKQAEEAERQREEAKRLEQERIAEEARIAEAERIAEEQRRQFEATQPNAKIDKFWTDFDVTENGAFGMRIHLKFAANNLLGRECVAAAYFYDSSGQTLKDTNKIYQTNAGGVSTSTNFTPGYKNAVYEDLTLFIPYSELELPVGSHDLKYQLAIYSKDNNQFYGEFQWYDFKVNSSTYLPYAKINSITYEHNFKQGFDYGMLIRIKFDVNNVKDMPLQGIAFFYDADTGNKLYSEGKRYAAADRHVATWLEFTPPYVNNIYNDFQLFIPYRELHLKNKINYNLKFSFFIRKMGDGKVLGSQDQNFTLCLYC